MEIELKFHLKKLPSKKILGTGTPIKQGYLMDGEIRIRQKDDRYFITVKEQGDLRREEWESSIPEWVFNRLWPKTRGQRVEKTRYKVPHGEFTLEVDVFVQGLNGLLLMECEFRTIDDVCKFTLPEWAKDAIDVTKDESYTNCSLAKNGLNHYPKY